MPRRPSKIAMSSSLQAPAELSTEVKKPAGAGVPVEIGLLTGGGDRHYAYGLATGLASAGATVDFVGGDEVDSPEMHNTQGLNFLNLRRSGPIGSASYLKLTRILAYYLRLFRYAFTARPRMFHILWNNKFEWFDRTVVMLFYRALGKKVVMTAHNVNAGVRDLDDGGWNRFTLKVQYRLCDRIFVHTEKMRAELVKDFGVEQAAVVIIPYGINNAVPDTGLSPEEARAALSIRSSEKVVLFFGNIAPYKGVEFLVAAFERLVREDPNYRLVIAGRTKKGCDEYSDAIRHRLSASEIMPRTIQKFELIPDEDLEIYFKAADVSVLPYTQIFQSGVLFLSYSFGLPVIVADVGCLREDVIEGRSGYVVPPKDEDSLVDAIRRYFASDLYAQLPRRRGEIKEVMESRHSWDTVAGITLQTYDDVLNPVLPAPKTTLKPR
jgi:glycosyltransferase involved in cell wall biosynthesis